MDCRTESLLKIDDEFVLVEEYDGPIPDADYIEGAIRFRFGNEEILSLKHWDLVDQLWAYLLEGLYKLDSGTEYDVCFPDQPLALKLREINGETVEMTIGEDSTNVPKSILFRELTEAAIVFFERMSTLVPKHASTWLEYATLARSLQG